MNNRRKGLLVLLIPMFGIFLFGGGIGAGEFLMIVLLMLVWVVAFFRWAKPQSGAIEH